MVISSYSTFLTTQEKNMPFFLATIGRVNYQTVVHRPLGIEHHQFLYTLSGKGSVFISGKTFELKPGSMLYLPPNIAHEYHCVEDKWETAYITFGGSGLNNFWDFEPSVWTNGQDFEFEKWFDILESYKNNPDMEKERSITLYALLIEFKEKAIYVSNSAKKKKHIFTLAMHELCECTEPNLENIAKKIGVSESHFCRVFKEYTGFRPFEYMNRLKLHKAKELLKSTDMSVKEVSEAVGFASHSYFSKLFKYYIGVTPSEYRHNNF